MYDHTLYLFLPEKYIPCKKQKQVVDIKPNETNALNTLTIKARAHYSSALWIVRRYWMKGHSLCVWPASIWLGWAARVYEVHCLRPQSVLQNNKLAHYKCSGANYTAPLLATIAHESQPSPLFKSQWRGLRFSGLNPTPDTHPHTPKVGFIWGNSSEYSSRVWIPIRAVGCVWTPQKRV